MRERLFHEILMARQRVYAIAQPTPLERISLPVEAEVYLKREDLSPIHSYKWRGAYNRMAVLTPEERERGVVAASAGNHAQGVALAAQKLGINARIYMPESAPKTKQVAVRHHGGHRVEVFMHGDNFDAAAALAKEDVAKSGTIYIHPYDDLLTMGGQGTLADEIVMSGHGPFDIVYLQIGGGGMGAAAACWLKSYYPSIRIVGVEGVEQASMGAAIKAGGPVRLDHVDVFCDGTAVKQAGDLTYPLCASLFDEFITVTNEEVCAAIQHVWESRRCIPEPSGAMGLAGLLKQCDSIRGMRALCILAGANIDFAQLAWVARHAGIGGGRRKYFRFEISERSGSMLALLETALSGLNIVEFQYGKVHPDRAWPVIGFEASPLELRLFDQRLQELGIPHEEVTSEEDVEFRIIHYEPHLFSRPYFFKFEFPERAGALHDFLAGVQGQASLCYFNYAFSGEQVGRALMGFEFDSDEKRGQFVQGLAKSGHTHREISGKALGRVL